ncbi:unnamed protein product, partial [Meganyctiphanes norvegica]
TTVGVDGSGVTSATLAGLRAYTRYAVVLQAFNSVGAGPTSHPVFKETLQDKPSGPPSHVTCEPVSPTSIMVSWSSPPQRLINGVIVNYRISYVNVDQADVTDMRVGGNVMSDGVRATVTGLTAWSNYTVTVAAATLAGEGVASDPVTCTTDEDLPSAVLGIKAVVSGPRSVVVSWSAPDQPHGRLIRYTVHWEAAAGRGGGTHTRRVQPTITHLTLHDLKQNAYEVWVTASTRVGQGPSSSIVVVTPSHKVGAGVWSVGSNVTAAWKQDVGLPCGTVGVPEPTISWTHNGRTVSSSSDRFRVQPDGTLTIADIQREDNGQYICSAENKHGQDSAIYQLNVIVPPSTPGLHVTETTTSSIRVQWTVGDSGGSPLTGARLHYRSFGGEWESSEVGNDRRAYTVTELTCGTRHQFYVIAHNSIGSSKASSTVEAQTKGRPPEAPP